MFYIFLKQFLFLFLFISFGYVIGRPFFKKFPFSSIGETWAFSIVTGWGIIALLMMFLGFSGWFRSFIVFPTLIVVLVISLLVLIQHRYFEFNYLFSFSKNNLPSSLFKKTVFLSYFILLFFLTAYPIIEWDAISYHLPVAREYISHGKIIAMPFLRFPVHPQVIDEFFALALMCGDALFANLISYAMAMVLVLLIYSFARRYFTKEIGLFSAFVFLSSPVVLKLSVVPYVEIGATLFCFSAFYAMLLWFTEKKLNCGILSVIFWGLALGSKYYAILFFIATFLAVIFLFNKKFKFHYLIPLMLLSLLIAFPWYFRNKTYSGDWFFHFLRITGIWDSTEVNSHLNYMHSFGLGEDIKSFFMLPINLLQHNDRFQENIGPFMIIGIGSLIFVRKWSRLIWCMVLIVIIYSVFWFYNFQILRYLFPVFPILSLLGGWTVQKVDRYLNLKREWLWTLLISTVLLFGCINCIKIIKDNGPVPVTNSEEFEYIAKRKPTYKAINFLNNIEHGNTVVYALFDEGSVFYHKNKVIGDWYGPAAYKNILPYINKPVLLHGVLKNYGAKYFLINRNKVHKDLHMLKEGMFKLVYGDQNAFIFEIL